MATWAKQKLPRENGEFVDMQVPILVSASRSTDIPAFYADWFFYRLDKAGYSAWTNPFNGVKSYVSYKDTRFIVFWSKNPKPLLRYLPVLKQRGIGCYIQYSLNDYEEEVLEKNVPPLKQRIETFKQLTNALGKGHVIWRFDPLVLTDNINIDKLLDKVDNIGHGPVRHGGGNVAGHSVRQSGAHIGLGQLLFPSTLAVQNITKALHQNVTRCQHIGQLAHLLRIGNGLVKGIAEIVGAQDRQVGIVRLQFLIGMAVNHRQVVVVILLGHKAARVLAEGAHLVFERLGITYELGFVENVVYLLHNLVSHLYPHAYIHRARSVGDSVFFARL